ncbi:MAG: hypothetical protein HGB11_14730 [Chlorobiales bacterium]|nr:hypothetical protein [Chlorobiales bacterium]
MRKEDILSEIESIARDLGYRVRYEKGTFAGGDCRVKEEKVLVVNKFLPIEGKIATISRVLGRIGIGNIFVTPQVRKLIDEESTEKLTVEE